MEKALVTGGAGFIGSHLVDLLLSEGWEVVALDDLSNGREVNLESARKSRSFSFHQADCADLSAIAPRFSGVTRVFHLAALADIVPSIVEPLKYHKANVDATAAVLEASRAAGVQSFVYAASSSCYGIPDAYPTPETAPLRPQYPYALTKRLGEELVLHWGQVYKLPVTALRLFNVYGPRARTSGTYGAVFGVFLAQKLAGKPFTVVGDGSQSRDFTYVSDVAAAFLAAAKAPARGEVYNVGSGGTYAVNELVDLLGGPVTYVPKRPGEPDKTFADISKIRAALGWSPAVSFPDGVKKVLAHIEAWRGAPVWDPAGIEKSTREWFKYLAP